MIRVLAMITVAGFVLSVGALAAAVAIGGPEAVSRGGWQVLSGDWDWDWDDHGRHGDWDRGRDAGGPQATRTLAWTGADRLEVDLPADVRYVQAPGAGSVVVTGPQRAVDRVVVRGGSIRYERRHGWGPHLSIVVTAPAVSSFEVSGANRLVIENYRQPRMKLGVSGSADVAAGGEVDDLQVEVSGSGDLDLGVLKARRADVEVSGAAEATIAPIDAARLDISGMGDVRLLTNPKTLETEITGAGKITQGAPSAAPPPTT